MRPLLLCVLLLAAGASAQEAWQAYRLRGTPFSLGIPPGAVFQRGGPPRSVEDGSYTLREVYGEAPEHDGIVIPLRHGFLSATYYRKPSVYASLADYLSVHRKKKPWGKTSRGTWRGMKTLVAGWEEDALDGVPTVTVHYVVEERRFSVLVLELHVDAAHLDEETPLFVKFKESLSLASDSPKAR